MADSSDSSLEVEVRSEPRIVLKENVDGRRTDDSVPPSLRKDGSMETEAVSKSEKAEEKEMEIKNLEDKSIIIPARVKRALEEAKDFGHYSSLRTFRYLHLFAGEKDALGDAIAAEATRARIKVECIGLDRKTNAEVDLSNSEVMEKIRGEVEDDEWDGYHTGFPCGSFSRARWVPGGPPPVRSSQEMYGLASNSQRQQEEADRGTLGAVRSSELMVLQCERADKRGIQRISTLENPPGTEGIEGSAWMLPEMKRDLEKVDAAVANYNTRAFQSDKVRWFKPGRWAGRIGQDDFKDLCKICRCPNWVTHKSLVGKAGGRGLSQGFGGGSGEENRQQLQEDAGLGVVEIHDGHQEGGGHVIAGELDKKYGQEETNEKTPAEHPGQGRGEDPIIFVKDVEEGVQESGRGTLCGGNEKSSESSGQASWSTGDRKESERRMGKFL